MSASDPTDTRTYTRQTVTPRPLTLDSAHDRGRAMQHWLDVNNYLKEDFIRDSGIGRTRFMQMTSGRVDLADATPDETRMILSTMEMADATAWAYFNIPPEKFTTFHTFRPPPWGHGLADSERNLRRYFQDFPLSGQGVDARAEDVLVVDPDSPFGLQLSVLDGHYYAFPAGVGPGQPLGELVRVELALRIAGDVPPPIQPE